MNGSDRRSPKIENISWGHMQVSGLGSGKDFKLWPGGGRAWDWTETGTRHDPGIQPADVEELIEHGSRVIVLSRGMLLRLGICPQTLELLQRQNIEVQVAETGVAVEIYNGLRDAGRAVGGLFHSTC